MKWIALPRLARLLTGCWFGDTDGVAHRQVLVAEPNRHNVLVNDDPCIEMTAAKIVKYN